MTIDHDTIYYGLPLTVSIDSFRRQSAKPPSHPKKPTHYHFARLIWTVCCSALPTSLDDLFKLLIGRGGQAKSSRRTQ